MFSIFPSENEFIERGFDLSQEYDRDEGIISYVRNYQDDFELKITFDIGSTCSVYISLSQSIRLLSDVTIEDIDNLSFQSWHGERTLRFSAKERTVDLRVHYDPKASIHVSC